MPNIATILKAEITRLARKEVRGATDGMRKALTQYRSDIAALKRRADTLERALKRAQRAGPARAAAADSADAEGTDTRLRFSAKGFASQRKRLGLSAHAVGLLVGASGQSVYNWETGKARPRQRHMAAIAALRGLGKKQAAAALAERGGAE
jgi:DNA-binding transcriptional regulator YiaG